MLVTLVRLLEPSWRWVGAIIVAPLGVMTLRGLFQGFFAGEVSKMFLLRRKRTTLWITTFAILPAVLAGARMEDRAKGPFRIRPVTGAELRAPVAGFLQAVYLVEGERASPGAAVARLGVPDLASHIAQKGAEVHEAQANLRLLIEGVRSEEIIAQRHRVDRARRWRDLAQQDLERSRKALQEELTRLEAQISRAQAEYGEAVDAYNRARQLFDRRALSLHDLREADTKWRVILAEVRQAEAQKRAREAEATRVAEAELSRRDQELAEAKAKLTLLEAGTRPAEIEAAQARLAKLEEEARYLEGLREKQLIYSPVHGVITTPHLRERIGQFFREGELICEVKASQILEAEIALDEQCVARVRPGQPLELKARALPFHTSQTRVDRIAPSARSDEGQEQSKVTVYCRLEAPAIDLRPGMTGYACIACGRRPIGEILAERIQGILRSEFWW
jgi:multidrug efflux pump subunit AcrA (membrane-fusion protein)